LCHPQGARS